MERSSCYVRSKNKFQVPAVPFSGHVDCLRLGADERNIAIASNDLIKLVDLTRGWFAALVFVLWFDT